MSAPATAVSSTLLTPRAEKWIRYFSTIAVFIVFIAALILSWNGLTQLAEGAGISPEIAWLFPVVVDGMVISGILATVKASLLGQSTKFSWFLTILGAIISVWGNVTLVVEDGITSMLVHSVPPLLLALSLEGFVQSIKYKITATATTKAQVSGSVESARVLAQPTAPAPKAEDATASTPTDEPKPEPAEPSSIPATALDSSQPATPSVHSKDAWGDSQTDPLASPSATSSSQPESKTELEPKQQSEPKAKNARPVSTASSSDDTTPVDVMRAIVEALPADTPEVDKVLAIINVIEKPSSADLAEALDKGYDEAAKRRAYRSLERARAKKRKLEQQAEK